MIWVIALGFLTSNFSTSQRVLTVKETQAPSPLVSSAEKKNFCGILVTNSRKHWVVENTQNTGMDIGQGICTGCFFKLSLKISSAKLFHFSDIWRAFGAIMYLLEQKGGGVRTELGPLLLFNPLWGHVVCYTVFLRYVGVLSSTTLGLMVTNVCHKCLFWNCDLLNIFRQWN
jgi:hypothetical protein